MNDEPSQQRIWSHFQSHATESIFLASHARHVVLLRAIRRLGAVSRAAVLNIGVGDGNFERQAQRRGWISYSLDPDEVAMDRLGAEGIQAQVGFIDSIPFPDAHFDFIVASEVLEHLTPQQRAEGLREIRRALKPGGYFLATVPYREDLSLNMTVCPQCAHLFHRWGHTTAFDRRQIRAELAPYFAVKRCRRTAFVEFRGRSLAGKAKSALRLLLAQCGAAIAVPSILIVGRKE